MLSGIAWPTNLTRHSEPLDKLRRRISCKAYMRFLGWRLWMTGWLSLRTKWSNPEKYYAKMIGISANRIRNIFLFLMQKKPLVFGQWQFIRNKKKEIIGIFLASLEVFWKNRGSLSPLCKSINESTLINLLN